MIIFRIRRLCIFTLQVQNNTSKIDKTYVIFTYYLSNINEAGAF